jgi:hypothetical protein
MTQIWESPSGELKGTEAKHSNLCDKDISEGKDRAQFLQ